MTSVLHLHNCFPDGVLRIENIFLQDVISVQKSNKVGRRRLGVTRWKPSEKQSTKKKNLLTQLNLQDCVAENSNQTIVEQQMQPNVETTTEDNINDQGELPKKKARQTRRETKPEEKRILETLINNTLNPTNDQINQVKELLRTVTRRIFSKLDNLKTLLKKVKKNQEDMKEEIKTIKEEVVILSHDQTCIDIVIIKSAQDLLEKKIYLNYDEFKESAEFFLRESDNEFFSILGSKWEPYFEKKIRKPLSKRLRSLRGTLCARVKTAIFENFSNMLPSISNVAKAFEIAAWKKKLAVSNCFRKLFEKIKDDENDTYMTKIIKNVWPKKKNIPNLQIAWAISISEIFLNLKNEVIKMSEEIIQPALARNLRKIKNEEGFEYESDSSPTLQRPVSPERQKDPEKQIEPERNKGKKRSIEVETLRKNLKKSKRKVENNEYEGKKNDEYEGDEGEEGEEGDEGEDNDDEDNEDEEGEKGEDEEYHNEIVNIENDENDTYMTKIIKNVWPKKKNIPNLQIAWAISISEIFLNLKNEVIKMSEEIIQPALARNLRKIKNEEGFEYESDSSPTLQRPVSPERQKDPEKQIEPERNKGKKRSIEVETLRKNLKKSKRKVENNEYEGKKNDEYEGDEGEEGEEGDEGEDNDDEDNEDEEGEKGEDEEYHNEIVNIESED
ncbi:hypothetical protein Glove_193g45 [Diversispora epigaea]|uniref:Uncharacterized protein n=1 Tax=Diversispora epigaea TaxID=1348612 RepID=A0A397ILH2_9GLOM|nr:hypothetical protein Glove_193g45 [Diversispora epigaea]